MEKEHSVDVTKNFVSSMQKRRSLQLALGAGVSLAVWHKPVINSVILPAHAQTSDVGRRITVRSLDSDNPFARHVLIVDSSDNVLANCGASGGTGVADDLEPGTYRIFADSDGPQTQIIDVFASGGGRRITVDTDVGDCDFLIAIVDLPSGRIVPQAGDRVPGPWSCSTNLNRACG